MDDYFLFLEHFIRAELREPGRLLLALGGTWVLMVPVLVSELRKDQDQVKAVLQFLAAMAIFPAAVLVLIGSIEFAEKTRDFRWAVLPIVVFAGVIGTFIRHGKSLIIAPPAVNGSDRSQQSVALSPIAAVDPSADSRQPKSLMYALGQLFGALLYSPSRSKAPLPASSQSAEGAALIPSYSQPREGVVLRLKRSRRDGLTGQIYMLDARIDAAADVLLIIRQHKLGKRVIYESSDRERHRQSTQEHLAGTRDHASLFAPPSAQAVGVAKTFWKLGRAAVSATRASLALRITVDSLLAGVHVECKSMDEILDAETALKQAKSSLEVYVMEAQSFDGREQLF